MTGKMKILIGYDVSDSAEAALRDLRRAGLPNDCEAVVMKNGMQSRFLWKGTRGVDRLLLGSVSATAAARAPCSVEVVRR